jgi:hypothetical protein
MAGAPVYNVGTDPFQEVNSTQNQRVLDGRAGRPAVRWLDSVEDDMQTMGVKSW